MIEQSAEIKDLFSALAKVQLTIKDAKMDSTNPHFKSRYASLAAVYETCRAACAKEGICITQLATTVGNSPAVWTMLGHSSGQWLRSLLVVPADKATAQGMGSALTYARRYSLSAIVGIAADEDDDGNHAETQARQHSAPTQPPPARLQQAQPTSLPSEPESYIFPSGKFKGRRMDSIATGELIDWIRFFEEKSLEPKGWTVEALRLAKAFVNKCLEAEGLEMPGQHAPQDIDNIPF